PPGRGFAFPTRRPPLDWYTLGLLRGFSTADAPVLLWSPEVRPRELLARARARGIVAVHAVGLAPAWIPAGAWPRLGRVVFGENDGFWIGPLQALLSAPRAAEGPLSPDSLARAIRRLTRALPPAPAAREVTGREGRGGCSPCAAGRATHGGLAPRLGAHTVRASRPPRPPDTAHDVQAVSAPVGVGGRPASVPDHQRGVAKAPGLARGYAQAGLEAAARLERRPGIGRHLRPHQGRPRHHLSTLPTMTRRLLFVGAVLSAAACAGAGSAAAPAAAPASPPSPA